MIKLMTHIVAGYPNMDKCKSLAKLMDKCGVSFIEIQIPFSDPVADGSTIMAANQKALENGVKVKDCFQLMKHLSSEVGTPLLFMSYFNILHSFGVEAFCKKAKECGCYGLIVPDIPFDEEDHEGYLAACKKHGLKAIQIVSPITSDKRLKQISKVADGFVYCVSRFGTTGEKTDLNLKLKGYLKRVKRFVDLPLAVGFGISNKKHVDLVNESAEIAVIGSKILNVLEKKGFKGVESFLKSVV